MKEFLLVLLILLSVPGIAFGQKEGAIGVFGNHIGIDFKTSPPTVFLPPSSNPLFYAHEGSAAISDQQGNLLFYTNGTHVWNKNHQVMPNGQMVSTSDASSTAQIQIVPIPNKANFYYIFIPGHMGGPLKYITVDMSKNSGLGDVVEKDVLLYESTTEKVQAIRHASKEAVWLITHEYGTNIFRTYLIDANGVDTSYVASAVGKPHDISWQGRTAIGYMKLSPSGTRLALGVYNAGIMELFDFDSETGSVYNPLTILEDITIPVHGLAFSPDESKLYTSSGMSKRLTQYDLRAGGIEEIKNSATVLSSVVGYPLQLGPDDKIYTIDVGLKYLGVINNPNAAGAACNFVNNAIHLKGRLATYGLPEFTHYSIKANILAENNCTGNKVEFSLYDHQLITQVKWNFGDPASGQANSSASLLPFHIYSKPGTYKVEAEVTFTNNQTRTFGKEIRIMDPPTVTLGADIYSCDGAAIVLTPAVTGENLTYKWQNGATTPTFTAHTPGKYWLEVRSPFCTASDTIVVSHVFKPLLNIGQEPICIGEAFTVNLNETETSYLWSDGVTGGMRNITTPGIYRITGTNKCGSNTQEFTVSHLPELQLEMPEQLVLCAGEKITLDASTASAQYRWQNGATQATHVISQPGTYWVEVYNKCEMLKQSIEVKHQDPKGFKFYNVITPNQDAYNKYFTIEEVLVGSHLSIFNRWGKEVFSSPSYQNNWGGEGLDTGTYYYILQDKCSRQRVAGYISVLR